MQRKTIFFFIMSAGVIIAAVAALWLAGAASVNAQCGSQASSCKNCHEVQGKDPVNTDGTPWHAAHAFGDFCYICHAGNNQATGEEEAHAGMVPPLSDVNASCLQCHPADAQELALIYAEELGVEIGSGGTTSAPPAAGGEPSAPPAAPPEAPAPPAIVVESENTVDYGQIYDETVLGKRTINWGDAILWLMIVGLVLGGGTFVYGNERKLRGLPFRPVKKAKAAVKAETIPIVEGYSTEVSSLLPMIAQLNPVGLHSLKKVLTNPDQANELLHSLAQLDPELVKRVRSLDRDARNLLNAMLGS